MDKSKIITLAIFSVIMLASLGIMILFGGKEIPTPTIQTPPETSLPEIPPETAEGDVITDELSLIAAEQRWTKEQYDDYYFKVQSYSIKEVEREIIGTIQGDIVKYNYTYDPHAESNRDDLLSTMKENEENIASIESHDTLFFNCMAAATRDPNYCLKIRETGYFKVQCLETIYLIQALESKDPSLCTDVGTGKVSAYCEAYMTRDISVCETASFENAMFKKTCEAISKDDFSICRDYECHFPFYYIKALASGDPTVCMKMTETEGVSTDGGDMEYCVNIVQGNQEFCMQYLKNE